MKILVTGGTGHLGRAAVPLLQERGHDVRVLARRPGNDPAIQWARGDLATGAGVRAAVAGVDAVVHAATNSPAAQRGAMRLGDLVRSPGDVDVEGTRALLAAAAEADVGRFVHVSIVGLEHSSGMPYSRVKLAAEELVHAAPVPWTIVRATGFYWLLDRMLTTMAARRIVPLPTRVRVEPVDAADFAAYLVACVDGQAAGERDDFAGPESLTMRELAEQWLDARGLRRRIVRMPAPRRVVRALEQTGASPAPRRGTTTWREWLRGGSRLRAAA